MERYEELYSDFQMLRESAEGTRRDAQNLQRQTGTYKLADIQYLLLSHASTQQYEREGRGSTEYEREGRGSTEYEREGRGVH